MKPRSLSAGTLVLTVLLFAACGSPEGEDHGAETDSGSADFTSRLIPISKDKEPQWEQTATLEKRMEHYEVPGVSIAVIDGFEIVWAEGFGSLRAGGETAVTETTLFHAGSVAKPVSTAAVLGLVEDGVLDLDSDVNDALTSWQVPENNFTRQQRVTLRMLLSHSAGIEDGITNRTSGDRVPNYLKPAGVRPTTTIADILDAKPGLDTDGPARVTTVPGSRFGYANADFAIVELLVRDATGTPFETVMQETVLDPLGMSSSTYHQPLPGSLLANAAIEHGFNGKPLEGDRLHIPLLAAGGLWTTPSDLALFTIEILDAYRGVSVRLLSNEMAQEMLAPQIPIAKSFLADAMALGFERSGEGSDFSIVHTGGTWGSTAVLLAYPERGQGAIIMTNSATGSFIRFEILLAIALEYGWPLVQE